MNLENIVEDWMGLISFFLGKPIYWLSLLAPPVLHLLGAASFLQVLITSSAVLFLSSFLFFFFTVLIPNQENVSISSVQEDKNNVQEQEQEQEQEVPFLDESESSINTEDSSEYIETTTDDISDDGSISDEESLIELSLPSGHYIRNYGKNNKEGDNIIKGYSNKNQMCHKQDKNTQDLRLFDQLFAEFNDMVEEDNLIEIDISIGSIKCSRFEIPA